MTGTQSSESPQRSAAKIRAQARALATAEGEAKRKILEELHNSYKLDRIQRAKLSRRDPKVWAAHVRVATGLCAAKAQRIREINAAPRDPDLPLPPWLVEEPKPKHAKWIDSTGTLGPPKKPPTEERQPDHLNRDLRAGEEHRDER